MPRKRTPAEAEAHFWSKVDKDGPTQPHMDTPCWVWAAGTDAGGYGQVKWNGRHERAHRVAWTLTHGPIPAGLHVLHHCDFPPCCRHLWLGTQADNMADCAAKGRQAAGDAHYARLHPERLARGDRHGARLHPEAWARGERNGEAVLTEAGMDAPRRRGRPPLPPELRAPRRRRPGESGRPPPPTADQVARVQALLAALYPPATWPAPPIGAAAELARRVGGSADAIRRVLLGQRAVSEATLAAWEERFGGDAAESRR